MTAPWRRRAHVRGVVAALVLAATRSQSEAAPWRDLSAQRSLDPLPPRNAEVPHTRSSAIVHLFEWKWTDISKECQEWLGPKGFTAIQVSPPNDHIIHPAWWARYQPVTYKLESRSGTEAEFVEMVTTCKKHGVGIYVDAVLNHVASGTGISINGSHYGGRATPIWQPQDFHHLANNMGGNCAIQNYYDKYNVQYCDMLGMPDICTGCLKVRQVQAAYLTRLINLGVAGFRIDAAKHMDAGELAAMLNLVAPGHSRYIYQEVYAGDGQAVTMGMYLGTGSLEYFDYSKNLAPNFMVPGKLKYMHNFGEGWGLLPEKYSVVFMDNHDTQRAEALLSYKGSVLYRLANIFMLAHPYGYPKIMSSFYFSSHDQGPPAWTVHGDPHGVRCGGGHQYVNPPPGKPWVCEHRWTALANMVGWRRAAGDNLVGAFWAPNGNNMFFCRGRNACIAFNRGSTWWRQTLKLSMPPGLYCDIIVSDNPQNCPAVSVDKQGNAYLSVPPVGAVALHVFKNTSQATTTGVPTTTATMTTHTATTTVPPTIMLTSTTLTSRTTTTATMTTATMGALTTRTTPKWWTPGMETETTTTTVHTTVTTSELVLRTTTANYINACVARSTQPGGLCYWGSKGPSGQLCNIQVTLECCRASGRAFTSCCQMKIIKLVPEAYREQAGLQECFNENQIRKCATNDENCAKFGCCEDMNRDCYKKNSWWSGCLSNCTVGMRDSFGDDSPWNCHRIEEPVVV